MLKKSKYVNNLLEKLKVTANIPKNLYDHFNTNLSNLQKKSRKIPVEYIDGQMILKDNITTQTGRSINNSIMIDNKDLDKGILRVRYSNNRKLTNNLLKHDYKISKRMIDAIKFNKDIHKLSNNEKTFIMNYKNF